MCVCVCVRALVFVRVCVRYLEVGGALLVVEGELLQADAVLLVLLLQLGVAHLQLLQLFGGPLIQDLHRGQALHYTPDNTQYTSCVCVCFSVFI